SATINLDIFYKRLAVMLEDIESEVYGKLINLLLPDNQKDNFYMIYDKEKPLTSKEKLDYMFKLNDKGWSTKHVVDEIGIDWNSYLNQTMYETEELELQTKISPYLTSHTSNSDDLGGRKSLSDSELTNEDSVKNRTDGTNTI
ncbi:hypothetical protein ACFVRU_55435, partial [Streptomyces sp. NPDC057927]